MIHLLHRRGDLTRQELREVRKLLRCLKASPAHTRFAVGAGVCLANIDFIRQFGGMQPFRQSPADYQDQF